MITYTTKQVADMFEVEPRNIIYHIQQKNLIATMKDGVYQIKANDLDKFEDYFYNERLTNKGTARIVSEDDLKILIGLVEDVKQNIPFDEFLIKYGNIDIKFPSLQAIIKYKRNEAIKKDKQKGMSRSDLLLKYKISKTTLDNIIYQKQKEEIL
jgi:uncharacterized protein (DUF433 family)